MVTYPVFFEKVKNVDQCFLRRTLVQGVHVYNVGRSQRSYFFHLNSQMSNWQTFYDSDRRRWRWSRGRGWVDKQKEFLRAKEGVSKVSREGARQMKTDWKTRVLGQGGQSWEASHALRSAVENERLARFLVRCVPGILSPFSVSSCWPSPRAIHLLYTYISFILFTSPSPLLRNWGTC